MSPADRDAELNRLKGEHQVEMEKLRALEIQLETELKEAEMANQHGTEIQKVVDALDLEQEQLESQLVTAQKSAEESIVASEESLIEAKKSVVDKIEEAEEKMVKAEAALTSQQDANTDVVEAIRDVQEQCKISADKETQLHECEMEVRRLKHKETMKDLESSIDSLKSANTKTVNQLQAEFEAAQATRDGDIKRQEAKISEDLRTFKQQSDDSLALLQDILSRKTRTLKELQEKVEKVDTRDEDMTRIEQLENALKLKTTHLSELTKDLVLFKKQMVAQEGVYNSRFGGPPNVAVLRPQTANSAIGAMPGGGRSRGRLPRPMQRPFTSASVRPMLLMHGRGTRI